jgi:carbamoyltransferase
MWNPDAVLRVEEKDHSPNTKERLDKAAATQMVFEDALFHVVDYLIRQTGSDKLVLTGGIALNAVANMRLLDRFDTAYYRRLEQTRSSPPVLAIRVSIGAACMFARAPESLLSSTLHGLNRPNGNSRPSTASGHRVDALGDPPAGTAE